jgi:PTH1 family peptidyl-tRNA hydrolase
MHLIVGLGNPGEEYTHTRHNVGAQAVECFRKRNGFPEWMYDKYLQARIAEGELLDTHVLLVLPETFMNRSGESVKAVTSRFKEEPIELVVVHDELDLSIGRLKIVFDRGGAGHHGVESIMTSIGSEAFTRLRIGIAPLVDASDTTRRSNGRDFVLSRFAADEEEIIERVCEKSADAIATIIRDGKESAMQDWNGRDK